MDELVDNTHWLLMIKDDFGNDQIFAIYDSEEEAEQDLRGYQSRNRDDFKGAWIEERDYYW